jgi:uncharacterized protein YjdB
MKVRTIGLLALLSTFSLLIACGGSSHPKTTPTLTSVTLSLSAGTSSTIALGTTAQFTATGLFSDGSTQTMAGASWTSSNPAVATIDGNGLVSSKSQGQTTITVTINGVSGSATITVGPPVLVRLSISSSASSVPLGLSAQFTVSGTMTDGTAAANPSVTWTSSNTSVATVSPSGLVTTKGTGQTTITVASGSITAAITLTVGPPALASLSISSGASSVPLGLTAQLGVSGTMTDGTAASGLSVAWTSSDMSVATVSPSALVTTKGTGKTTITVTSGSVSTTMPLTVTAPVFDHITLSPADASVALGLTQQFTAVGILTDGTTQALTSPV